MGVKAEEPRIAYAADKGGVILNGCRTGGCSCYLPVSQFSPKLVDTVPGDSTGSVPRGTAPSPNFRPMSVVAKRLDGSRYTWYEGRRPFYVFSFFIILFCLVSVRQTKLATRQLLGAR